MDTRLDEIADGMFRISTGVPIPAIPGGFSFNQFLIRDRESLLFHTGPRGLFEATREAVARVVAPQALRYVAFGHHEADESGAMNEFLAWAPEAVPLCSRVAAMVSMQDLADRPPRAMADGEVLDLGGHKIQWLDTPHVPHGWDAGLIWEAATATLLCGDLFTQPGAGLPPVTEGDVLGPSEAMRAAMDYYSSGHRARAACARLQALRPGLLATMHGSAFRGDGGDLLRRLAQAMMGLP